MEPSGPFSPARSKTDGMCSQRRNAASTRHLRYVEKDFWVCLVLDMLYNGLPAGHPKLLFKGGTSLSTEA